MAVVVITIAASTEGGRRRSEQPVVPLPALWSLVALSLGLIFLFCKVRVTMLLPQEHGTDPPFPY